MCFRNSSVITAFHCESSVNLPYMININMKKVIRTNTRVRCSVLMFMFTSCQVSNSIATANRLFYLFTISSGSAVFKETTLDKFKLFENKMGNGECDPCVLPPDVLLHMMQFLDSRSLLRAGATCSYWHEISKDDILWRKLGLFSLFI